MRTFRVALGFVVFLMPSVQAQDVMPAIGPSAKAVLFSFSGLAALGAGNFDGGVGGKYFLSDDMAVRAGLRFATAGADIVANPGPGLTGTDGSRDATTIGVSGAVEIHLSKKRVSPYLGGGLLFLTTSTEMKSSEVGNPPPAQTVVKNNTAGEFINGTTYTAGSTFTVFGLFGVEFFLYNEMSLAAEYRIGFSTNSRPDQETTSGNTTTTVKVGGGTTLGFSNGGALTLAVYF